MVKNYRWGYNGHEMTLQRSIRYIVSTAIDWIDEYGKEEAIKDVYKYFNALRYDRYRIRAYKRFGKWLRETEV